METANLRSRFRKLVPFIFAAVPAIAGILILQGFQAPREMPPAGATYSHRLLPVTIPYHSSRAGRHGHPQVPAARQISHSRAHLSVARI